jgi:hypothetical protein
LSQNTSNNTTTHTTNGDTANLVKIRRLNSNETNSGSVMVVDGSDNKLYKKPPLDKEKRQQLHQQQGLVASSSNKSMTTTTTTTTSHQKQPSMQGWLYKMREPSLSSSSSSRKPYLSSSSSSLNTLKKNNDLNKSPNASNDFNVQGSSKAPKWKNYW